MNDEPFEASTHQSRRGFPWVTLILSVTAVTLAGFVYDAYLKTGKTIIKVGDDVVDILGPVIQAIPEAAKNFKTGTITQTFTQHIPEVSTTHGDILELTTSRSEEEFRRTDSKKIAWDTIDLGTTVSVIRVPATFQYHLRLSDSWRLAARDKVCYVLAPSFHPSLPTAFQTDQMQKSTESRWARFNKSDNLAELEKSITPQLDERARDPKHVKLVREACRQSVGDFVQKWLMKEDFWRNDRFSSIVVVFSDEATVNSDEELEQLHYEPTVKLN
jgi:hypothetical protein